VALLALVALGAGCVRALSREYPEKQRFLLEVERPASALDGPGLASGAGVLRVDRIRVSPLFERKRFVYRTTDQVYEDDFYHEFYVAPNVLVRTATREWMSASPVFASVLDAGERGEPDWFLEGRVMELYGDLRDAALPRAVLAIEYTLIDARSQRLEVAFQRRYRAEVDASAATAENIVAGWNQSLVRILSDLEGDLRRLELEQ
jgi:hypothetical protein